MCTRLKQTHATDATTSGLSKLLRRSGYTYKKYLLVDEAVRGRHRRRRHDWITRRQPFMRKHRHRLVFIDETSVNTKLYRTRGWGLKGQRIHDTAPMGGWKTHTFIAGLRQDEMIAPWVLDGPMNKAAFETYVQTQLAPALNPGDVVQRENDTQSFSGSFHSWIICPRTKVQKPLMRSRVQSAGSCQPTAQISIRSRWPSRNSRLTSDASAPEPSKNWKLPLHPHSTSSRQRNAATVSKRLDMDSIEGRMLYDAAAGPKLQPVRVGAPFPYPSQNPALKRPSRQSRPRLQALVAAGAGSGLPQHPYRPRPGRAGRSHDRSKS